MASADRRGGVRGLASRLVTDTASASYNSKCILFETNTCLPRAGGARGLGASGPGLVQSVAERAFLAARARDLYLQTTKWLSIKRHSITSLAREREL